MEEIFKVIEGHPDYEISNLGRIKSKRRKKHIIMSLVLDPEGYQRIRMMEFNTQYTRKVHRLVAQAFLPNLSNLAEVNHINGVKTDNRVENLEWCDKSHNMQHALRIGLKVMKGGKDACNVKLTEELVGDIRATAFTKSNRQWARELGLDKKTISNVRRFKSWK